VTITTRVLFLFSLWFSLLLPHGAEAATAPAQIRPTPPHIDAQAYILVDFHTGQVLAESNADQRLEPASLTKLMTAFVVFQELRGKHIKLDDSVVISKHAWRTPGSRMFAEVNKTIPLQDLLQGMIIQSGNDASVALAEHVAGSEEAFASLMNQHAKTLGLEGSHFVNSPGLPDPNHYTTARDVAKVTRALIQQFPDYYKWYSQREFTYNGITQYNRNRLLWRDPSVDGVKTGYTEGADYCLVASALRDGMRLISVVMGAKSAEARARQSEALLNYGFHFFETHRLYKASDPLTIVRVWKGDTSTLPVGLAEDFYVTVPRGQYDKLSASLDVNKIIVAPVAKGQAVGTVNLALGDQTKVQRPLVALQEVPEGGVLRRLIDQVSLSVHQMWSN
jgi:serine-type D-Ala-D-Ala carboxypeptidase (penicillin-binding protein 5/6)